MPAFQYAPPFSTGEQFPEVLVKCLRHVLVTRIKHHRLLPPLAPANQAVLYSLILLPLLSPEQTYPGTGGLTQVPLVKDTAELLAEALVFHRSWRARHTRCPNGCAWGKKVHYYVVIRSAQISFLF